MRNVIFDFDGTLVDSLPGIAWSVEAAFGACRRPWRNPCIRHLVGPPIRHILAEVSGVSDTADLDRLERAFRGSYDSEGWRRTVCQEGTPEMLREMQASGVPMWLVTNKPAGATFRILQALALGDFFEDVVCRDSRVPPFACKAEMLADLLARHELDRQDCLVVGDTMEDMRAAAGAGIACALTPHGYGSELEGPRLSGWRELLERTGGRTPAQLVGAEARFGEGL